MKNKNLTLFAKIISAVFSPAIILPALLLLVIYFQGDGIGILSDAVFRSAIYQLILIGVIPITITFIFFKKIGKISDWEIKKREERHLINIIVLLVSFLLYLSYRSTMSSFSITKVTGFLVIWYFLYTTITFFWKISAHTSSFALLYLFTYTFNSWWTILGAFIMSLIVWARVYRKNHNPAQALGGIILSVFIFLILGMHN